MGEGQKGHWTSDIEYLWCPLTYFPPLPQATVTCIFQLQKLKLQDESFVDEWQGWDLNPGLSGSRAMSHPTSHTLYWDNW